MFFTKEADKLPIAANVDKFGDSYTRATKVDELRQVSLNHL